MNFTSQICTSRSQSERLLALGLKKETADCQYAALVVDWKGNPIPDLKWRFYDHNKGFIVQNFERMERIPAWSLHRLIEMMPQWIDTIDGSFKSTIDQGKLVYYREISDEGQIFVFGHTSLYDSIIDTIEKLIKEGYFNKKYLKE